SPLYLLFFFNVPPPTEISTLSLHDALPISRVGSRRCNDPICARLRKPDRMVHRSGLVGHFHCVRYSVVIGGVPDECPRAFAKRRSEEHTSELQSQSNLVCRLLLEKKKTNET